MSKIIHNSYQMLNPAFNIGYELMQEKKLNTYAYPGSTKDVAGVLKELGCKKPLFITDKMIVQLNLLESTIKSLEKAGLSYSIFDSIKPDPTIQVVEEGVNKFHLENCDSIISFGGGSSIDAAKVISGLAKNIRIKKYMGLIKMQSFSLRKGNFPIISIPTTAGTGAEVTMGAVISNTETHKKGLVVDNKFVSRHVFLDANLTLNLPAHITAAGAYDALSHAIEAYVSKFATSNSRKNSIEAIKDIFEYLPKVYKNGKDLKGREKLLIASNKAGHAICRTHIGTVHSIAHNAGAIYGIAHGLIIALVLPYMCEVYREKCETKFAELADAIGITNLKDSAEVKSNKFINAIWSLSKEVDIPKKLDVIKREKYKEVAERAIKESYLYPVPMYVSEEEVIKILEKIGE